MEFWTELIWTEETVGGRTQYVAPVPNGNADHQYVIRGDGGQWSVTRTVGMPFLGPLDRQVASLAEAKDVAQEDSVRFEHLARWAEYMTTHNPPTYR